MGDSTGEPTHCLHLLRLAKLLLQEFPFRDVLKKRDYAFLSGNLDDFSRIQCCALFTGLCTKSDFQVPNRALFFEYRHKPGTIFAPLPKLQLQGGATNNLLASIPSGTKETLIHIQVAAVREVGDGNGFWARIERFMESLLGLQVIG